MSARLPNRDRPSKPLRRFLSTVLLPSVGLTLLLVILRLLGALEGIELGAYDRFVRWRPDEGLDERLLVVGIDESDLQTLKRFPVEDGTVAELLEKLEQDGPRVIGLDVGRDIPQGPAAGRERLTQVIQNSGNVVSACMLSSSSQPGVAAAPGTPDDLIGFADFPQDPDGKVRRTYVSSVPGATPDWLGTRHLCNNPDPQNELLSFSFVLTLLYLTPESIAPEQTANNEIQFSSVVLTRLTDQYGGYRHSGASDYQTMLNYRSATHAVRQVTLTQVLRGKVDPAWIKDRVVLIGYTSAITKDILSTPYLASQNDVRGMPGVVIHAQAVSQLLSAVLDHRPLIWSWSEPIEILWIWGWSILGGVLVVYVKRSGQFLLLGAIALAGCLILPYVIFLQGGWIPVVPSTLALIVTVVSIGFIKQSSEGGYTQAVYEQLKDQMRSLMVRETMESDRAQQTNYLEDLVRRARKIRQSQQGDQPVSEPSQESAIAQFSSSTPLTTSEPEKDTTKELYQQIKLQVEQELEQEQRANTSLKAAAKKKRIQDLLNRARDIRSDTK